MIFDPNLLIMRRDPTDEQRRHRRTVPEKKITPVVEKNAEPEPKRQQAPSFDWTGRTTHDRWLTRQEQSPSEES